MNRNLFVPSNWNLGPPFLVRWCIPALLMVFGTVPGHTAAVLLDGGSSDDPLSGHLVVLARGLAHPSSLVPALSATGQPIPRAIICASAPEGTAAPDEFLLALQTVATSGAKEPIMLGTFNDSPERLPLWRVRFAYFQGTVNSFGEIFTRDVETISQNGLALTVSRMLVEDLWNTPFNLLAQSGFMWHNEQGAQSDGWQAHIGLNLEWDRFPWDECLQTRLGIACGFSYANQIPYTEIANIGDDSSKHFLHYLEPSLSLNCGDLVRLFRIHRLCLDWDSHSLDDTWLVGSIPHRSGMWGVYGDHDNGNSIRGASNYLSIGIQSEF
jgi:hypothetical protein